MIARLQGLANECHQVHGAGRIASAGFSDGEFAWNLRDHIVGLNLGRWDYMASLIHFNLENPEWVLPDRNTIPPTWPSFRIYAISCRRFATNTECSPRRHDRSLPSREDAELNARH